MDESDPMVFELGDNKVVFVPQSIDTGFIADTMMLFGFQDVSIIQPPDTENGLSRDIRR